jgi:hypothetical protein
MGLFLCVWSRTRAAFERRTPVSKASRFTSAVLPRVNGRPGFKLFHADSPGFIAK